MKRFKKLTAGLLGAVMALSVCSFTAFAADGKVAKIGNDKYDTIEAAANAAVDGDTIVLLDDATTDDLGANASNILEKSLTYDLNGHDLTYTSDPVSFVEETLSFIDSSVSGTRRGGTLYFTGVTGVQCAINPNEGAILNVENINVETTGSAFFPQGNAAEVNIKNCDVNAKVYCVGTNAATLDNYGVIINLVNSKFTSSSDDGDNTAVTINVEGTLNIKNCELTGDRQALIVRAGKAVIEDTEITVTGKFAKQKEENAEKYQNGGWGSGNEVPTGAVIVGNITSNAYKAKADVKIENSKVVSKNKDVPAVFTEANENFSSEIEIAGKDSVVTGKVMKGVTEEKTEIKVVGGNFDSDITEFIDKDSHLVEDKDGNFVVMDEEEYEDYLDDKEDKKPSHSYELEEGRVEREDEEDEKDEPAVKPEPEEEAGPFSDVGKDNPNYDAIIKVYENGWMAGIGDGVFAPNGTLTRGMGVTVLWNKAGKPEPQNVAPFLDVTSDDWYAKAVAWAYEQGIVAGYGDVFGPDDALTTEQFTRMSDIANGKTPEIYVGGAPSATRGWVASLLAM